MKHVKLYIVAVLLLFSQTLSIKADDSRTVYAFFKTKNWTPCRTIIELFAPNCEFMSIGNYDCSQIPGESDDNCNMTITIACDNTIIYVSLHKTETRFDKINISGDDVAGITSREALKCFIDKMTKENGKGEIAWVEKKWKKTIHEMTAEELCLASLTLQYWKSDFLKEMTGRWW